MSKKKKDVIPEALRGPIMSNLLVNSDDMQSFSKFSVKMGLVEMIL